MSAGSCPTAREILRAMERQSARLRAELEYRDSTTRAERVAVRRAEREAEIRAAALDLLTPEQQAEVRSREIAKLERPPQPFKWDPYKSQVENAFRLKKWQAFGGRVEV